MILKSTQTTRKETEIEKERFFYNIGKRHKAIDFTRPNELGTTMSKVATKSPDRIWL
jgi:hypothetical protein